MYFNIKILYDVNNPHGFLAELTFQMLPQAADFPPIFVWHAQKNVKDDRKCTP